MNTNEKNSITGHLQDKAYCITERSFKIASSSSSDEILISESTNISFIGNKISSRIIIETENEKYVFSSPEKESFPCFFSLLKIKYKSYASLDGFSIMTLKDKDYYGKYMIIKSTSDDQTYLIRTISKKKIFSDTASPSPVETLLYIPDHPFQLNICFTIEKENKYYIASEFSEKNLFSIVQRLSLPNIDAIKIWTAELLIFLEHLTKYYSDPIIFSEDNLLLDTDGHLKFYVHAEQQDSAGKKPRAFDLFPPEKIENKKTDFKSIIWSFGCCLYYLMMEKYPFENENQLRAMEMILNDEPEFSKYLYKPAMDLIKKCLQKKKEDRPDFDQIKNHPFFAKVINWESIFNKECQMTKNLVTQYNDDGSDSNLGSNSAFYGFSWDSVNNARLDFNLE